MFNSFLIFQHITILVCRASSYIIQGICVSVCDMDLVMQALHSDCYVRFLHPSDDRKLTQVNILPFWEVI